MKLQYVRAHIPTGTEEVCDFHDHQLMPNRGASDKNGKVLWVGEAEKVIDTWNKMGVVDGKQVWYYKLAVAL